MDCHSLGGSRSALSCCFGAVTRVESMICSTTYKKALLRLLCRGPIKQGLGSRFADAVLESPYGGAARNIARVPQAEKSMCKSISQSGSPNISIFLRCCLSANCTVLMALRGFIVMGWQSVQDNVILQRGCGQMFIEVHSGFAKNIHFAECLPKPVTINILKNIFALADNLSRKPEFFRCRTAFKKARKTPM